MKKPLIISIILLLLVIQEKAVFSKAAAAQSDSRQISSESLDYHSWQSEPPESRPNAGQTTYLTHPEFTGIVTTTVTIPAQNTGDGYIFLAVADQFYSGPPAALILDDTGEPVYIKLAPDNLFVGDFRKQTVNGADYLTYHTGIPPGGYSYGSSYVLNENYELVDTWTIDNGNGSDLHEFLLLDNGHAILMAYVPIPFDLSPYGGPIDGTLIDIVLQEQDANKNVVFEWRASQYMPIGDTEANLNTTNPVDFLHTNAIEVDDDGNWLLSHRNFSEITKIDRQTGEIIWRMGGQGNEFTFTNDIGFSKQHNINRLENGNITLFDNGNDHDPAHSRAVEYAIDEIAKTVTRVWSYPDDMSIFSVAMGNNQRLPNGNSMIGWGSQPFITEVQNDGTVALEIALGAPTYRAFRFPWDGLPLVPPKAVIRYGADPTAVTIYTSWNGATDISGYDIYAGPTTSTLTFIGNASRTGFETEISLTALPENTCFFQTKPVRAQGSDTLFSNMMFRTDLLACWEQLNHPYMPVFEK